MKRTLFLLLVIFSVAVVLTKLFGLPLSKRTQPPSVSQSVTKSQASNGTTSLIVPYWGVTTPLSQAPYDEILYFGVEPMVSGQINTAEAGYLRLESFQRLSVDSAKKFLILRMIDSKQSFEIIENEKNKKTVITQTVQLAREAGFDGVVLDLEVQALPFDSVIENISSFTKEFSRAAKKEQLTFGMLLYGDVFYRLRPFDARTLGSYVDRMYVMAYDFHKARGNPGPNFPLAGNKQYGYDLAEMTEDFQQVIPSEKITVVFGMFGYDWEVDEGGHAKTMGVAKSMNEMKQFLEACQSCITTRESLSGETKVSYTAEDGALHIMWFEDVESAAKKKAFFKEQGITSFSYWAHTYF